MNQLVDSGTSFKQHSTTAHLYIKKGEKKGQVQTGKGPEELGSTVPSWAKSSRAAVSITWSTIIAQNNQFFSARSIP
jgi:hypothetical protein